MLSIYLALSGNNSFDNSAIVDINPSQKDNPESFTTTVKLLFNSFSQKQAKGNQIK